MQIFEKGRRRAVIAPTLKQQCWPEGQRYNSFIVMGTNAQPDGNAARQGLPSMSGELSCRILSYRRDAGVESGASARE